VAPGHSDGAELVASSPPLPPGPGCGVACCTAQSERSQSVESERSQSAVRAWSSAAACVAACGGAERQELSVSGAHLDRAATRHVRQGTAFFAEPVVPLVYAAAAVPAAVACAARRQGRRAARRPWHGPDRSCSSTPAPPSAGQSLGNSWVWSRFHEGAIYCSRANKFGVVPNGLAAAYPGRAAACSCAALEGAVGGVVSRRCP
jgi:hypothetical protein